MSTSNRLEKTFSAIDDLNQQDPTTLSVDGKLIAKEHLYALRMSERLSHFKPEASEHLVIACRAQHLQRWSIARNDYPMDRQGYKRWRTDLAKFHADTTAKIMAEYGYSETDIERVRNILQKKQLKQNEESQAMEDVACLVFLEFYMDDFAAKHSEEKMIDIIRKTWAKMSSNGHQAAMAITFSNSSSRLVNRALSDD